MEQLNWEQIGFPAPSKDVRVVVAMSGGVDSSVTASLLAEAGYDVVGITLQLYDHGMAVGKSKACCAGQDIYDASQVAEKMGFPHYILDYESVFKQQVIDDFADSYLRGETPIPCIQCNQQVKFKDLLHTARDLGGHCLVTGHYVQRIIDQGQSQLHQAIDTSKDQSYFLFATKQEELDYLRFPLGGLTKDITRAHAQRFGLSIADKPDSQDICFVPNGNYAEVVKKLRPGAAQPGEIVDHTGSVLGRHPGIIHYTIGQRKGLGVGGNHGPLYVVKLDHTKNQVIVGPKEMLGKTSIHINRLNWLDDHKNTPITCSVKIRSSQTPMSGIIALNTKDEATITLDTPEYGVSPGQAAVLYDGSRLLGGGWILAAQ